MNAILSKMRKTINNKQTAEIMSAVNQSRINIETGGTSMGIKRIGVLTSGGDAPGMNAHCPAELNVLGSAEAGRG